MIKHILVSFILIVGCSEKFKDDSKNTEAKVYRKDFGRYLVIFETPKDSSVSVIRTSKWTNEVTLIAENKSGSISDEEPRSGELYTYLIGQHIEGNFIQKNKIDVSIPFEIQSSEVRTIPSHFYKFRTNKEGLPKIEIETLVIDKEFPLELNTSIGEIIIKKLFSNNGTIETHFGDSYAIFREEKNDVVPLHINILSGEGYLNLILRGQNGGKPPKQKPIGEEGRGPKGKKGTNGIELHTFNHQLGSEKIQCSEYIGQGGKGGTGLKGLPGINGMNGGDSPLLYLTINPSSNIGFSIERFPGAGGEGGDGGEGGPGGYPGDPGDLDINESEVGDPNGPVYFIPIGIRDIKHNGPCNKPPAGEFGNKGESGDSGTKGSNGKIQKYCIKDHNSNSWSCEK